MRLIRSSLLAALLAGGSVTGAGVLVSADANASVSIAVAFDALVKDADAVSIATPLESKSVWEEGRIYTYTRLKVEQGVAGELANGSEGWVRTMGGVVGKIGQLVDGEPVFTNNKSSLVFLRKFKTSGTWEVSARAQGQYAIVADDSIKDSAKGRRVMRSAAVGVLLPPKTGASPTEPVADQAAKLRLAGEVIHDRPLDEVTREIAASWKKLHAVSAPSDAKK
jgi:hypothetical protein